MRKVLRIAADWSPMTFLVILSAYSGSNFFRITLSAFFRTWSEIKSVSPVRHSLQSASVGSVVGISQCKCILRVVKISLWFPSFIIVLRSGKV